MPLTNADLTRIYRYRAFDLGAQAGGPLTYNDVITLIQQQITNINETDTELGTTFAAGIQADLNQMDTLDTTLQTTSGDRAIKQLDVIHYFPGGTVSGNATELERLRARVARVLSQSYGEGATSGVSELWRG
ncbi:MAG: hypothetical protein AAFN18_11930 [Cyanobacteria bacterium J06554_6]